MITTSNAHARMSELQHDFPMATTPASQSATAVPPQPQPAPKRSHKRPKDRTREPASERLCWRLHSCPITLDAFSQLRYPPFELRANPALSHKTSGDWFDGRALAAYLCATGTFTHPLSRRGLARSECVDLDSYLVRHRLGECRVVHAFDNQEQYHGPRLSTSPLEQMRLEAEGVLHALFSNSSRHTERHRRGGHAVAALRVGPPHEPSPEATQPIRMPPMQSDGLTLIDDDLLPTHARTGAVAANTAAVSHEEFPALPRAAPQPRKPLAQACAPQRSTGCVHFKCAANEPSPAEHRRACLASAFGRSTAAGNSFAAASACRFSQGALVAARQRPQLIAQIESSLDEILSSGKQRITLPAMPRADRTIAHELARHYHVATIEIGAEPNRCVHLLHTDTCEWPMARVSDVASASNQPSTESCSAMSHEAEVVEGCCNRTEPTEGYCNRTEPTGLLCASAKKRMLPSHMHVDEPSKPRPWRSPTVMAKAAGKTHGGVRTSDTHATARDGGNGNATGSFLGQHLLSWNALRRLIWSAVDTANAMERLAALGLPKSACLLAVQIAGGVDESTQLAASNEWLLQHIEALGWEQEVSENGLLAPTVELANPWASRAQFRQLIEEGGPPTASTVCDGEAVASGVTNKLTWHALRRLIWSSLDADEALERLESIGFPESARRLAVQISGGADGTTRAAARREWLLQHIEAASFTDANPPLIAVEAANPWRFGLSCALPMDAVV
uniref:R3H domain-containing protein n=1 Tax=Calcidiscus leptoporus TaxID=127549 RepID=A0A7S0NRB5_9EUKA